MPKDHKATRFRRLLTSPQLEFAMEAHNGLSAKIVEEAGFEAVWASGLSVSAALGVRDNNEASWTQVLEVLEFMSDACSIPIMLDGDTGYGNFNNMRRLVTKLGQRDIAAVCIEDKLFPKTNSFLGEAQPLADIDEFCGKIKAGKDHQPHADFCVVARVEALISGWGINEALRRAEAYHRAGADAILIHSKRRDADEILEFVRRWANRCPVVIVPTTYYATPTPAFRDAGVSMIIWANHNLRSAISAMRETSRQIRQEQSVAGLESRIAPVRDVFRLQGNEELEAAEKRYLPSTQGKTAAIVLAASRGAELHALTQDRPKCMIDVRGQPLLARLCGTLRGAGVQKIGVVRGYMKSAVNLPDVGYFDNDEYESTGEVASLARAEPFLSGPCLLTYGDILFSEQTLGTLLGSNDDIALVVDARPERRASARIADRVVCDRPYGDDYFARREPVFLRSIGRKAEGEAHGEWIGLALLSARGAERLRAEIAALRASGDLARAQLPQLFDRIVGSGQAIRVHYIAGGWLDIDDAFDLARARNLV
jgi:phosphoenolpyruvate phosphomutase